MSSDDSDLAIVGLSCRLPGARNAQEFWKNLAEGVDSISHFSREELQAAAVPEAWLQATNYVSAAPVLDNPAGFDADFFGYTAGEARLLDPQHRLLLELAHEALEDAGCDPRRYAGRVGVFAGAAMNTYFGHAQLSSRLAEDYIPTLIANDKDFLSTRISYKLNLQGPSLTVQTACSTGLVAVHLARQSLLSGETDLALAGAVSVRVPHRTGYFADGGVTSMDGRVRAFDAEATGTVFGSGGGVIVLKRLSDALADGDRIRAIVKGSAVNNDGAQKAGYTAPSVHGQADAVLEALANAGVEAAELAFFEAHGSGTPVGDPIEVQALTQAFRASTKKQSFCALGSVKTNIGHLDAAAGLAGLIKAVLALEHRQVPASLHFTRPNPEIDFPRSPFYVNTRLTALPVSKERVCAGVLSTGMGGTNACVILEAAEEVAVQPEMPVPKLLCASAKSPAALEVATAQLADFLETAPATDLGAAAYTLQVGRTAHPHRRFAVGNSSSEVAETFRLKAARGAAGLASEEVNVVLLLPGVGDQYVGMGRDLYARFPAFREAMDRCEEVLQPMLETPLKELLYPAARTWPAPDKSKGIDLKRMVGGGDPADADTLRLNDAAHVQAAIFSMEYALAKLWEALGVLPSAYVGHSLGEYTAACLAGVFSLEDALRLVVCRTRLARELPPAQMLAVALPEAELRPRLPDGVSLALINGGSLCVTAGAPVAIDAFASQLAGEGVLTRPVRNTHAFHSEAMVPIAERFEAEVRKTALAAPSRPLISNVTGRWMTATQAVDPGYWARHLHQPARFHDALGQLWALQPTAILEVGPGQTLGALASQHPARPQPLRNMPIASLRPQYDQSSDVEVFLRAVGQLWVTGAEIDWTALHGASKPRKIALPTYPFQRQRFWLEPAATAVDRIAQPAPDARAPLDDWFYTPSWTRTVLRPAQDFDQQGIAWLLIGSQQACKPFHAALRGLNAAVETVEDPNSGGGRLRTILGTAKSGGSRELRILHCGALAFAEPSAAAATGFVQQLLALAQAIGDLDLTIPAILGLVTAGLHEVIGGDCAHPTAAAGLGFCSVLPQEYPSLQCFNVDLPPASVPGPLSSETAAAVLAEFGACSPGAVIAHRGRWRWKRSYEPVRLPTAPPKARTPRLLLPGRLRERGVYVITGGAGGLGLALARRLAKVCRARIALVQRTRFPESGRWPAMLADPATPEALTTVMRQVVACEEAGAEIELIAADVCEPAQMHAALDRTLQRFGAVHGVLHAAGVVRAGLAQAADPGRTAALLAPKVAGTLVLHDLLRNLPLDFFVLFSSMASIAGPFAHSEYAGANAFLDAFAPFSNRERPYPTLAVNWPTWREVGTLARLEAEAGAEALWPGALEHAISTDEAVEVFTRTLESGLAQVIVSPQPLPEALADARRRHEPAPDRATPELRGNDAADVPVDDVDLRVRSIWEEVFGFSPIGPHDSFAALGGHSLLALRIVTKLRSSFQIELTLREFFGAPSIAELGALIQEKLIAHIETLSDEEVSLLLARADQNVC